MAESEEELKNLLMRVKENEKAGLKLNIRKAKIIASDPIINMANRRGKGGSSQISSSWALKSLWMVTAAMKLDDDCFLGEKL